ncbi:MAG: aminotransferase class V-fold PLP-dependent enzyme [Planctomycetia bacterium]|nr:aminotransferase class V-fold PLP-dependent enzyme [Planctomycetia bacterium]
MMPKYRLMTPGPTQVPEASLLRLAEQVTHHRTPEFRGLLAEVLDGLKYVFQTTGDVLLLTSSGTGAMEAAVASVVPRGGKAIVLESGKFSQRWRKLCERFGIEVVRHEIPWGEAFDAADVARLLAEHPDAVAVYATLSESSTGVGHDIEAIGRVVNPTGALLVVDGISGVGVMESRTDAWGIDLLVVGSQKALMVPPGLAFVAVSPKAWRQIESIEPQAFYFDLSRTLSWVLNRSLCGARGLGLVSLRGFWLRRDRQGE